jgi:hypothetical protein
MADNRDLVDALKELVTTISPADTSAALLSSLLNTNNILSLLVLKTGAPAALSARLASLATTNATSVKPTAGKVYRILLYNSNASIRYLKIYNMTTPPVVGTDIPLVTLALPATALYSQDLSIPISCSSGIAYAMTGGVADTDTTAITANDIQGVLLYV